MFTLNAEIRDTKIKPEAVRKAGNIPAVFYGRKEKSQPVLVEKRSFNKVLTEAGQSAVISLKGSWGSHDVLLHDVSRHPVSDEVEHVDFYVLEKDRKVKLSVPLEFTGVSPAVKDLGGTLVKVLYDIEIEALPKHLPSKLVVDIGALATLESQILAKDVVLPEGVALVQKPEEVVASISQYVEEVVQPVMDISQIEVEKKGKVEEEGAEAGAEGSAAASGKETAPKKEAPAKK